MKFLDRYLKSKSYWIGLNDRKKENAFAWTDGTKVDYTNWGKNQPDNFKNEDCVELDKKAMGYVFNDNKCTKLLPFVCKMKGMRYAKTFVYNTANCIRYKMPRCDRHIEMNLYDLLSFT